MITCGPSLSFMHQCGESLLLQIQTFHRLKNYTGLPDEKLLPVEKGPVKLMQRVKIAHSFLQSVSNQFRVIILSLSM